MKKFLFVLLSVFMLAGFVACDEEVAPPADGSSEHPYRITSWDELKSIADLQRNDGTTYVVIENDITIPADEYIEDTIDNFVISGAGNGISLTASYSDGEESNDYLFQIIDDTTIRNINYDMGNQLKTFICSAFGDVTLEDITIDGNIEVTSNNETAFIAYGNWNSNGYKADEDCDITFIDCTNRTDFNDVANSYGAPFISFTMPSGTFKTNLIFDSCSNEGNLFYGKWASILVGNAHEKAEPGSVTIRNGFTNSGGIGSFGKVAFCSHNDAVENAVIYEDDCSVIGFEENKYTRDTTGLSFGSGSWNVTSSNEAVKEVRLLGRLYIGFYNGDREIEHAANYTLPIASSTEKNGTSFTMAAPKSLKVIGSVAYTEEAEDNTIVTHNNEEYWYVGPTDEGFVSKPGNPASDNGIADFREYYLAGYDGNGNAIVMVKVDTLPQSNS